MIAEFNYTVANAALTGIFIVPVFVLGIISLFQAKRRKDPVRDGVPWLKIAFMWFFLSLLLTVASDALFAAIVGDTGGLTGSDVTTMFKISNYLSLIGGFFEQLASTFCLVAMVEFGYGFYTLLKPGANGGASIAGDPTKNGVAVEHEVGYRSQRRTVQIATAFFGVVLLALSVALLGKVLAAYVKYYGIVFDNDDGTDNEAVVEYAASIHVARKLGAAFDILVWVLSLPLLGFAGYLVHRAQGLPIKGTVVLYLVATIFWFLRFLWHLIYNAIWLLPDSSSGAPLWFNVADPLLNVWLFFVTLLLLNILAARRSGGLWSTAQPWTHFGGGYPNQEYGVAQPFQYASYNNNNNVNLPYAPAPQGPAYMPGQQQHHPQHMMQQQQIHRAQFHEMAHPVQPVYPQEMYATPQPQYSQPYGVSPQQQQQQQHVSGVSPQATPSPINSKSAHDINSTPPSELKS